MSSFRNLWLYSVVYEGKVLSYRGVWVKFRNVPLVVSVSACNKSNVPMFHCSKVMRGAKCVVRKAEHRKKKGVSHTYP